MNKEHQKILVVCEHGSIRSVAMGYLIKTIYQHQHEVLNCGIKDISPHTFSLLYNWADKIIWMDKSLLRGDASEKDYITDVGEDIWHDAQAQELTHLCLKYIKDLDL